MVSRYNRNVQPAPGPERRSRLPGAIGLTLGLYALVLLVGPALHHDLACHLKSSTHCTSCLANVTAPGAASAAGLLATDLRDAGALLADSANFSSLAPVQPRQGRAPPA